MALTLDNFEDNDIAEYSGDTGQFQVQGTTVQEGSYALQGDSDGNVYGILSQSGLKHYPSAGDTFSYWVHPSSGSRSYCHFGVQDKESAFTGVPDNGYMLDVSMQNDWIAIEVFSGGSSTRTSTGVTINAQWYKVEVDWGSGGSITATLYDNDGSTKLASVSVTDTSYKSGGLGWGVNTGSSSATAYFDDFQLTTNIDAVGDYGYTKTADATSSNTASLPGYPAYVRLEEGTDSTGTGAGVLDSNAAIDGKEDIGFFDENGDPVPYYWVNFDTTNGVYEAWVLTDIVRDGTQQLQVGYGSGNTDDSDYKEDVFSHTDFTMQARYDLESVGDGTAEDSTINDKDGTVNGVTSSSTTQFGTASGDFDGSDDIKLPSDMPDTGDSDIYFSAWVHLDSNGGTGSSRNSFTASENDWLLSTEDGDGIYLRTYGDNNAGTSTTISTGTWHQVVLSYTVGGTAEIWLDGTKLESTTVGSGSLTASNPTFIGARDSDANGTSDSEYIDGRMEEIRYAKSQPSDEFIIAEYDMSAKAGYALFSWNSSTVNGTTVSASPTLGEATPITATTTPILGNWRGYDDARVTTRTQTKVEGEHAQKWKVDASKTTAEKAVYRADQTISLDLSTALGTTGGSFTQGTFGWHIRIENSSVLRSTDALKLKIGSDSSNYAEWTLDKSELGPDGEYTYYTFSHDEYDQIVGSPDWTTADFFELTLYEASGNATDTFIYVDYLTVSDGSEIGANGLGDRRDTKKQVTTG